MSRVRKIFSDEFGFLLELILNPLPSNLNNSMAGSDGSVLESIAAKNIEIGSLKEQVYSLQKQLKEV